jgi:hypothetical protein
MISNEQLLAFVRKNPITLGCGVLAIGLAAAIYLRGGGIPAAETELEQKATEGRRLELNLKSSAQLPEHVAAMSAALAAIEPRLVHADELANNLQYFYKLESETGTKLGDLRQLAAPKGAKNAKPAAGVFAPVAFSASVQGEYPALLDFLRRLENGDRFVRVASASINLTTPDRTGPLSLQLDLELLGLP